MTLIRPVLITISQKIIQREMRNQYEYELGLLTGMNEAIMNQNDQMRDRILQQNAKIQEV